MVPRVVEAVTAALPAAETAAEALEARIPALPVEEAPLVARTAVTAAVMWILNGRRIFCKRVRPNCYRKFDLVHAA